MAKRAAKTRPKVSGDSFQTFRLERKWCPNHRLCTCGK